MGIQMSMCTGSDATSASVAGQEGCGGYTEDGVMSC